MSGDPRLKPKRRALSSFGSPYLVPKGMDKVEFLKIVKIWNEKLQKSGHFDIEDFNELNGTTSPFLYSPANSKDISGSSHTVRSHIRPALEEYYRLCRVFLVHANFEALFTPYNLSQTYKCIFKYHADGMSYRHILAVYNKTLAKRKNKRKRKSKSIFWIHSKMQIIITEMMKWHVYHPEGLRHDHGPDIPELWQVYLEDLKGRA